MFFILLPLFLLSGYLIFWKLFPFIIRMFWDMLTITRWTQIRRRDLAWLGLALAIIGVAEVFSPSLAITGRQLIVPANQYDLVGKQTAWPKASLTPDQFSKLAPWLYEFSDEAHRVRKKRIAEIRQQISELSKKIEIARNSRREANQALIDSMRENGVADKSETLAEVAALEAKREERSQELESLTSKKRELYPELSRLKALQAMHDPMKVLPTFDRPITVIHDVENAWFKKTADIAAYNVNKEPLYIPLITGFNYDTLGEKLQVAGLHLLKGLNGNYRPAAKGQKSLSCLVSLEGETAETYQVGRFCEIIVSVPIDFDLTSPTCGAQSVDRSSDLRRGNDENTKRCMERWIAPPLVIQLFDDHFTIRAPQALDTDFSRSKQPSITRWELDLSGHTLSLDGTVTKMLPEDISKLFDMKIKQLPKSEDIQIWNNVETDLARGRLQDIRGDGTHERYQNSFTGRTYRVSISEELYTASQFLKLIPPPDLSSSKRVSIGSGIVQKPLENVPQREDNHINQRLIEFAGVLDNLGALSKPKCKFSTQKTDTSHSSRRILFERYPRLMEFSKPNSEEPDCGKAMVARALVANLLQWLE